MQTLEAIEKRKSVRSFLDKEVSKDKIQKIIDAGKSAPSAGGLYPQKFLVKKTKEIVDVTHGQNFVAEAPVAIIVLVEEEKTVAKYGERGKMYAVCDGAAAVENMLLAATDLGLGSCWIGAFDEKRLKEKLETESKPIAIIPIGYER